MKSLLVLEIIVEIEIDGRPIFIFSQLPPNTLLLCLYIIFAWSKCRLEGTEEVRRIQGRGRQTETGEIMEGEEGDRKQASIHCVLLVASSSTFLSHQISTSHQRPVSQ